MKVLVCGGRDYTDSETLFRELDRLHAQHHFQTVISGLARGADSLARDWAKIRQIPFVGYPAQWDLHGRSAGPMRNIEMLREGKPDLVVAFPGGRGTQHMTAIASAAGVTVVKLYA